MDAVGGLRSMAHIPKDERQRLFGERETAVELLTSRVKVGWFSVLTHHRMSVHVNTKSVLVTGAL